MSDTYVKSHPTAPEGFFAAEARGLAWLAAVPDGARVARVRAVHRTGLEIERLQSAAPTPAAAVDFGAAGAGRAAENPLLTLAATGSTAGWGSVAGAETSSMFVCRFTTSVRAFKAVI